MKISTALFRLSTGPNLADKDMIWCDMGGNSYASVRNTVKNRKNLAKKLRLIVKQLEAVR